MPSTVKRFGKQHELDFDSEEFIHREEEKR